jgi:hypothetical protein
MELRRARLCLDCEEIHEDQHCPVCASESFAFLTRWIPAEKTRPVRPVAPPPPPPPNPLRWVGRGAAGLAVLAFSSWLWKKSDGANEPRP